MNNDVDVRGFEWNNRRNLPFLYRHVGESRPMASVSFAIASQNRRLMIILIDCFSGVKRKHSACYLPSRSALAVLVKRAMRHAKFDAIVPLHAPSAPLFHPLLGRLSFFAIINQTFVRADMDKNLEDNGILDDDATFEKLGIDDDGYTPVIHIYYNDDLTIA